MQPNNQTGSLEGKQRGSQTGSQNDRQAASSYPDRMGLRPTNIHLPRHEGVNTTSQAGKQQDNHIHNIRDKQREGKREKKQTDRQGMESHKQSNNREIDRQPQTRQLQRQAARYAIRQHGRKKTRIDIHCKSVKCTVQ